MKKSVLNAGAEVVEGGKGEKRGAGGRVWEFVSNLAVFEEDVVWYEA